MEKSASSTWKIPWKGIIIAFILGVVALTMVFSKVAKPKDILRELENYPKGYFYLALSFVIAAWLVDGQRIGILVRALDHRVAWWQLGILLGAANFLTLVTPFAGGGGALIIYFLYRQGMAVPVATAVVTAGGIAGQISLSLLAFLMFSTVGNAPAGLVKYLNLLRWGALAYAGILVALLLLITKNERWVEWFFKKRGEESRSAAWVAEFRATYKFLLGPQRWSYYLCLLIALFYYFTYYLGGFTLLTGFAVFTPWLRLAISVLFGIAPVFSPTPGGAGASELIAYLVLDNILPGDALGTFILLWRSVVFYLPIIFGGIIFTLLVFRWAAEPKWQGKEEQNSPPGVILSQENDHNK